MLPTYLLPSFLPSPLLLMPGAAADYRRLERFHYRPGSPATFCQVSKILYEDRLAAIAVLSWPTLRNFARERALGWLDLTPQERGRRANAEVRTISRIVIHPQFRSIGLSTA